MYQIVLQNVHSAWLSYAFEQESSLDSATDISPLPACLESEAEGSEDRIFQQKSLDSTVTGGEHTCSSLATCRHKQNASARPL